jgi:hypothetical protein
MLAATPRAEATSQAGECLLQVKPGVEATAKRTSENPQWTRCQSHRPSGRVPAPGEASCRSHRPSGRVPAPGEAWCGSHR